MATANPLGIVGGMFLEIGAVVAVLAVLWQPQPGDAQPAQQPDFFAERPIHFQSAPARDHGDLIPARTDSPPQHPALANLRSAPEPRFSPAIPQYTPTRHEHLLPAAPAFEPLPRTAHVEAARPLLRRFSSEERAYEQPAPRYALPISRTAETMSREYYERY